jgi:Sigma-70 region 2
VGPSDGSAPADAALWRRAAAGDQDAFGALFDRHSGAVYSYLFRRTAGWSAAEDLTAAAFLQAWPKRSHVVFDGDAAADGLGDAPGEGAAVRRRSAPDPGQR